VSDTERIVNDGRGPRFHPNRRLSAPHQYGHPWTWRESLALVQVTVGVAALAYLIVQVCR
jgi:hypothetical protein